MGRFRENQDMPKAVVVSHLPCPSTRPERNRKIATMALCSPLLCMPLLLAFGACQGQLASRGCRLAPGPPETGSRRGRSPSLGVVMASGPPRFAKSVDGDIASSLTGPQVPGAGFASQSAEEWISLFAKLQPPLRREAEPAWLNAVKSLGSPGACRWTFSPLATNSARWLGCSSGWKCCTAPEIHSHPLSPRAPVGYPPHGSFPSAIADRRTKAMAREFSFEGCPLFWLPAPPELPRQPPRSAGTHPTSCRRTKAPSRRGVPPGRVRPPFFRPGARRRQRLVAGSPLCPVPPP